MNALVGAERRRGGSSEACFAEGEGGGRYTHAVRIARVYEHSVLVGLQRSAECVESVVLQRAPRAVFTHSSG